MAATEDNLWFRPHVAFCLTFVTLALGLYNASFFYEAEVPLRIGWNLGWPLRYPRQDDSIVGVIVPFAIVALINGIALAIVGKCIYSVVRHLGYLCTEFWDGILRITAFYLITTTMFLVGDYAASFGMRLIRLSYLDSTNWLEHYPAWLSIPLYGFLTMILYVGAVICVFRHEVFNDDEADLGDSK